MRILLGLFGTVLCVFIQKTNGEIPDCDFFDTVDVSAGQWLSNGSYLFEDLVIPAHLTGEYDFKLQSNNSKEHVASHLRGCVCQLKTCVRFCCDLYDIMSEGNCFNDTSKEELDAMDPFLNITLKDGSVVKRHFKNEMFVQRDLPRPCDSMFYLDNRDKIDEYTLFENGTFLRHHGKVTLNKQKYCLQHLVFDETTDTEFIQIAPYNCHPQTQAQDISKTWHTVVMVISLICMLLTISVYLFFKKLRNLHGQCFICYMVSLFMAYLFFLLNLWDLTNDFCITAGFIGYFFVMAAFLWLSVISLHLWMTFKGSVVISGFLGDDQFLAYSICAWGLSFFLTGITYLVDKVADHENWAPRMGNENECWIYTRDWSAMIYLYGPILLLIAFNITTFVLTARIIISVKRSINNFTHKQDKNKKLNSDKQSYTFFLRLFIIMGLSWSFEIISYLVQDKDVWAKVFRVTDYFNWSQGTIVFIVFILKRSTLKLIRQATHPKPKLRDTNMKSGRGRSENRSLTSTA
ncbi:G-protein coupled receptor Mth-like isoform X1 [Drosophila elegans]|uniref:G-protein coupled receptor Mth-like isoform X1 n=1 Tax=Drosophila elegans TaxID=30023 RepID=UPI0007E8359B|nr:G-protein coupled receptor Mth-like isoform X1 [Drosophila elegans]